jgi:hypothetical protein
MINRTIEIHRSVEQMPEHGRWVLAYYAPAEEWCLVNFDHNRGIWTDGEGPDMDMDREEVTHWFEQPALTPQDQAEIPTDRSVNS